MSQFIVGVVERVDRDILMRGFRQTERERQRERETDRHRQRDINTHTLISLIIYTPLS